MKISLILWAFLLVCSLSLAGCSTANKTEKTLNSNNKKSESSRIGKRHITYLNGVAAEKQGNYKDAVKYYRQAAQQGHFMAMHNLGFSYAAGRGVPQDYKKALYWYKRVPVRFPLARFNIGMLYFNGMGVQKDYKKALVNLRIAMKQGHVGAINTIGYMYSNGLGVTQNKSLARQYYIEAATKGNSYAINNLGVEATRNGKHAEARQWYGKAARLGNKLAIKNLNLMNKHRTTVK